MFLYIPRLERGARPCPQKPRLSLQSRIRTKAGFATGQTGTAPARNRGRRIAGDASVIMSKNHDMDLGMYDIVAIPTIIQIRHPLFALVSDYELYLKKTCTPDSLSEWKSYARLKMNYWKSFAEKWAIHAETTANRLLISYEQLNANPLEITQHVLKFILNDHEVNQGHLESCVELEGVAPKRDLSNFRHFNLRFFQRLEDECRSQFRELKTAGITSSLGTFPA